MAVNRRVLEAHLEAETILVIEDEPLIRMTLNDELSSAGFHVLDAGNASEAMAILEAGLDVGCVVSDVIVHGEMNGLALAWKIRRRWPRLAVVLSTGKALPSPTMVPERTSLLHKPYGLDDLVAVVTAAIGGGPGIGGGPRGDIAWLVSEDVT